MLAGKKTILSMAVALTVALYGYFVEPIPAVDPQVFNIVVPVVALVLRLVTKGPVTF